MARYLKIVAGVAVNAEEWASAPNVQGVTYVQSDTAHIGSTYSGGTLTPVAPTLPVPQEVKRVQGRLQLIADGRMAAVTTAVAGADAATQEYWASTAIFTRTNPMLNAMWTALGFTQAQLDTTFINAAQRPL